MDIKTRKQRVEHLEELLQFEKDQLAEQEAALEQEKPELEHGNFGKCPETGLSFLACDSNGVQVYWDHGGPPSSCCSKSFAKGILGNIYVLMKQGPNIIAVSNKCRNFFIGFIDNIQRWEHTKEAHELQDKLKACKERQCKTAHKHR